MSDIFEQVPDLLDQGHMGEVQFVASVSHELRGPLHGILGLSELLLKSNLRREDLRLVESLNTEAESLKILIDDILDYSKLKSSKMELEVGSFSPGRLVSDLVETVRVSAVEKNLALTLKVDPNVPIECIADSLRFGQVVRNLLTNAIRYTDQGGIEVFLFINDDGLLTCQVNDTGIGIATEKMELLFKPFEQVHEGRSGGNGLGLAISYQIAHLMGGSLNVESQFGVGSKFTVSIPFEESFSSSEFTESNTTSDDFLMSGMILVVEDNPVNQMLAKHQLESLGFQSEVVSTGEAALKVVNNNFKAVLMDWNLPGLDGLETSRCIRRNESIRKDLPIIAMTANALTGDRDRCLAAGMNDFLAKPVSLDSLKNALLRWATSIDDFDSESDHLDHINFDILKKLTSDLGNTKTVEGLIEAFIKELDPQLELIKAYGLDDKSKSALRASHTLASTSELLGASRLANLCRQFNRVIEPGEVSNKLINIIESEVVEVKKYFQNYLLELGAS